GHASSQSTEFPEFSPKSIIRYSEKIKVNRKAVPQTVETWYGTEESILGWTESSFKKLSGSKRLVGTNVDSPKQIS
ncbi:hypothetical protein J6590_086647, partial [Homalodisca vitripennis]